VDVWSHWTPYPFNELPKTYSFMVKNPSIWRMGYYVQQPRVVHYPTSAVTSLMVHRKIGAAFDLYQPDLVVSVHPLMQHVPLSVLRQRIRCFDCHEASTLKCRDMSGVGTRGGGVRLVCKGGGRRGGGSLVVRLNGHLASASTSARQGVQAAHQVCRMSWYFTAGGGGGDMAVHQVPNTMDVDVSSTDGTAGHGVLN